MTLEERKELGNRLKQARKEKGLSQEELANLIGLKVGTVSKYEQGDRTPGIGKLQLIANALECDISRFVASGDEYVRMTQTTDYGNNLDAYLNWLKFSHFGCNPCQIENDDGSKSSSYLISFDKETFPISEEELGRVMEYQKEQFKQLIRLFGENLR
ncbi:helix-turn-helix transcriptional regulator [Eubacterium sp. AF17-7]|uniref:helix-turn-helix domain-containing protein n=1 Tax=Eubacterium sp. AF17-7 TaxID=2293105 RepID=UPI0018F39EFA|nr:helix-turn-helix transcriptional regulator [Eubacterium sp. AF17-7]